MKYCNIRSLSFILLLILGLIGFGFQCPTPNGGGEGEGEIGAPQLSLDLESLDFGVLSGTGGFNIQISNEGGQILRYRVQNSEMEVMVTPEVGEISDTPQTVEVDIDLSGFATGPLGTPGIFVDVLVVNSNGGMVEVPVSALKADGNAPVQNLLDLACPVHRRFAFSHIDLSPLTQRFGEQEVHHRALSFVFVIYALGFPGSDASLFRFS